MKRPMAHPLIPSLLVVVAALVALNTAAQNLRVDDEVYVLGVAHATTPWSTSYASDAWATNETGDRVKVTVTYIPINAAPVPITSSFTLAPHESREYCDIIGPARTPAPLDSCKFIGLMDAGPFGYAIFDGCLDGADCAGHTGQPSAASANYRAISVGSRTYSFVTPVDGGPQGPTVGQYLPGLTWWTFADPHNPVKIAGIRAITDRFHTNLLIINASPYSGGWFTVSLYDGASVGLRDQASIFLKPREARQVGILELFPLLAAWVKANPTRPATNAFVVITENGVVLTDDSVAFGCSDGCPGFYASASLIDGRTGDVTPLEAIITRPLANTQIVGLFGPSAFAVATPKMLASGALGERAQATALANMTQNVLQGLAMKAAAASAQSATVKAATVPLHKRMEKD